MNDSRGRVEKESSLHVSDPGKTESETSGSRHPETSDPRRGRHRSSLDGRVWTTQKDKKETLIQKQEHKSGMGGY